MADNSPRPSFRLRSSERRILLILGDLVASIASDFAAIYVWRLYLYYKLLSEHFNIKPERAWALVTLSVKIPLWFYLLPIGWLLLMVELYDPHVAASWRRTLRGIEIAAFIGIVVYSLIFIITSRDTTCFAAHWSCRVSYYCLVFDFRLACGIYSTLYFP